MKIGIYTNQTEYSQTVYQHLKQKLEQSAFEINNEQPDIVLTIGGDGTVLNAVHFYEKSLEHIKFMGIHTGHLGYYTDWLPKELDELIVFLKENEFKTIEYPLLEIDVVTKHDQKSYIAFNEMTLLNSFRTQHLNITINDVFFESFRGTGICVSTPTGSTAYNKSLNGAIVYPTIKAIQLTEIASLNNNVFRTIGSPLLIPEGHVVVLESESFQGVTLTRDHLYDTFTDVLQIKTTLSPRCVSFITREEQSFWHRVKQHFL